MQDIILPSIFPVTCHTDHVGPGSTFVAIHGFNLDGTAFIPLALQKGATRIVVEQGAELAPSILQSIRAARAHLITVPNTRKALAALSAQGNGNPAQKLKIIGITGTKGKTTSAFLLEHVLRTAGKKVALVSTVYNMIDGAQFAMRLTTPQPDYLHMFFRMCVDAGVEYVVMEAAAQAFTMHRLDGIEFDGILFTNFDQEHAEFYATLDDYFAAKCLIFDHCKSGIPMVVNADDPWCQKIMQSKKVYGYGFSTGTMRGQLLQANTGISLAITNPATSFELICPSLIGAFNGYNILGVATLAQHLHIHQQSIIKAFATFSRVPGRLEQHPLPNGARCIIDYAHNPSSYKAVLSTLRQLTDHLIVVFGCGGDRDQSKRPIMGAVAAEFADIVILTSDNPRSEDPAAIVQAIRAGINGGKKAQVFDELDREKAIRKAYQLSKSTSIVVLLGKGPDEYQIVGKVKQRFSEAEIVRSLQ